MYGHFKTVLLKLMNDTIRL